MDKNEKIDNKYLFQLNMLNGQYSVIDYINKVIEYEKLNNCHVDNKQFHHNFLNIIAGINNG